MQKYYSQKKLNDREINQRDLITISLIAFFVLGTVISQKQITQYNNTKVVEPYYKEKFYKLPSKKERFGNKQYDIAISFLPLKDNIRNLKYKLADLNKSMGHYKSDINKHKAMNEIIFMLKEIRTGNVENIDISKMQQAVLEAGFGNIEAELLEKAVVDYKNQVAENKALAMKVEEERRKLREQIKNDAKDTSEFALGLAREVAEDEIEGFVEKLSLIARVGSFVVKKVQQ